MITIKNKEEINKIREGGKKLAQVVHQVAGFVKPGISAMELDVQADKLIKKSGGEPSFKGFNGYPAASCISINEGLVHGIPSKNVIIQEGDIVSVDIGLKYKGLFTDMAVTVPAGRISKQAKSLILVTQKALDIAVGSIKAGGTIGDIGFNVQRFIENNNYSVVRSLVGHGVGYKVHEDPRVPNFGQRGTGPVLKEGMVLALEPMVNIGGPEVITKKDNWTIVTADGSLSAHFEHTVVITGKGAEILTK
ncbi:type I methionyl aminopeptidase [Patescibacteria group bacterium]|nr:type I methionyl aminopeptidase [Patescibacteria group bacterium]MBU0964239.1 type I methionyl aminopeptidase [Patescibacteria group bacterium]